MIGAADLLLSLPTWTRELNRVSQMHQVCGANAVANLCPPSPTRWPPWLLIPHDLPQPWRACPGDGCVVCLGCGGASSVSDLRGCRARLHACYCGSAAVVGAVRLHPTDCSWIPVTSGDGAVCGRGVTGSSLKSVVATRGILRAPFSSVDQRPLRWWPC